MKRLPQEYSNGYSHPKADVASDDEVEGTPKYECSSQGLQSVVDSFCLDEILGLDFSMTIADPLQADCPLVACSTGFTKLTGYEMSEIVGRNCRFLVDGIPPADTHESARKVTRHWIRNVQANPEVDAPPHWLTDDRLELRKKSYVTDGELWCVQTNKKKSGELFQNFFFIKQVQLHGRPFLVGLQAAVDDSVDPQIQADACANVYRLHTENMESMQTLLSSRFWYEATMRRQVKQSGTANMQVPADVQ